MIECSFAKRHVGNPDGPRYPAFFWGPPVALLACILFGGCAHKSDAVQELTAGTAPFTQFRDETIQVVVVEKRSLGAADLNSLALAYTPLEEKANAYAHFLVESVRSESFNADQNNEYAVNFAAAINTFDKAYASIVSPKERQASVSSAWVSSFSTTVASDWTKYKSAIDTLPSETKVDLIKTLQVKTLWPNYEDIATEPLATPAPSVSAPKPPG